MNITFNNKQGKLGKTAVANVADKIGAVFSKFEADIVSVEVCVKDVNGPRGGVDKRCRLLIRLRRMKDVVASVQEDSVSRAISRAVRRAERAIKRKVQRRGMRNLGRKPALGFAVYSD
ncbi:HPF/RaiA family ribosome-associated protein [Mariniblastus fucicola]|uniref:Sigma 54 modulation protein / S30EA ribosomal protein n=1 Tax=Mariniblastus fucicola TaxID=980251 RepID=A0A5B9PF94_9BACT|nr:hypothetical protein MFFC18_14310 [Mariniblastus fucicola]